MLPVAPWTAKYIGLPFKPRGRDFNGVDCYGLFWLVQLTEFGRTLPVYDQAFTCADVQHLELLLGQRNDGGFVKLPKPALGCAVLLYVQGLPAHVGAMVGEEEFIHANDVPGYVERRRIGGLRCPRSSVEGYYAWRGA